MIEVSDIVKRYGATVAVNHVSFKVDRGEILGFLGPNGAGKSTTLKILTCFIVADSGTVTVEGQDVLERSLEVRQKIGYLPENTPLYSDMRVTEYLEFVARIKMGGSVTAAQRRSRITAVMERTRVADMAERHCAKLSKGYRQRVGLAQAIIHNPEVLILDEPTAGLDPKQIIETRELIRSLAGDHTVILSTHILPEVAQTCQRVVIINKGRVVAVDTPENLTGRLRGTETMYVQVDGGGPEAARALEVVPGVTRVTLADQRNGVSGYEIESAKGQDVRSELARAIVARGWGLLELRPVRMSLEEIFLHLTTEEPDTPGFSQEVVDA